MASTRKKNRSRSETPEPVGRHRARPSPVTVLISIAVSQVSFSGVVELLDMAGFKFWDHVKLTLPLITGFALISLVVGVWLSEKFCSGKWLALIVAGIFSGAGWLGTIVDGKVDQFFAAYEGLFRSQSHALVKIVGYGILSVVGFFAVYGTANFLFAALVGAVAPWVGLYVAAKTYSDHEKKLISKD